MADKVKTVRELKLVAGFSDGDDRTLSVPNPKSTITASQLTATAFYDAAKAALIGDKTGAAMTGWKSAKIFESTTVYLDLATA